MTQTNTTRFVKNWDRHPWHDKPAAETPGSKLYRVEMTHLYTGIIEGQGTIQYLFANNENNQGGFVALEKISGQVEGRSGSFVLQHTGTFGSGATIITMTVVPGTGTGDLIGLSGQATMEFTEHLEHYPIHFEYTFEHDTNPEETLHESE
jgi:hypothetical protein